MTELDYELVTIADEIRVAVPPSINLLTTYVLKEQLDWFEDEMHFIRKLARPGMNVIDIGANYGAYALTIGKRIFPGGRLWAFEPSKRTADFLRTSVSDNGLTNVQIIEAGLSNREGDGVLHTEANAELNTLNPAVSAAPAAGGHAATETVRLTTLDACSKKLGWSPVTFVKLDAEGEETRILEGGKEFFATNDPLCMFEFKHGTAVNTSLASAFRALGYSIYRLLPGLSVLVPFTDENADPFQLNLFACSATRAEQCAADGLLMIAASTEDLRATDAGAWRALACTLPYATLLADAWALSSDAPTAGREHVEEALLRYAEAHDATRPISTRVFALESSLQELSAACEKSRRPSRLLSVARVAAELGHRMVAIQALDRLLRALEDEQPLELDEPFLSPCPRFDAIAPKDDLESWCLASVLEQLEMLVHYSSFYTQEASLPRLTYFQELGFPGPQMERRLALVQARAALPR